MSILDTIKPVLIGALKQHLPDEVLARFKERMEDEARQQLEAVSDYPEGSVGSLMTFDFILLPEGLTAQEAILALRARKPLPEQTDQLFICDEYGRFLGAVSLNALLLDEGNTRLQDLLSSDVITFQPKESGNRAGQAFERYDLISAAVTDARQRVRGRLTVEAVMDFRREQAENQALASAGLSEDTDLFAPVWKGARERWPWLAINLLTAFAATRFIAVFESTLEQIVSLAVLMPIIASIGGNTGNQTIALLVRGLALDQIKRGNRLNLLRKELAIAGANGLLWGGLLRAVTALLYREPLLGLVMASAMLFNLMVGAIMGAAVPLVASHLDRDPAMGSSVVLTFITDSMGFFIFLGLATLFLL